MHRVPRGKGAGAQSVGCELKLAEGLISSKSVSWTKGFYHPVDSRVASVLQVRLVETSVE
ncbi:protein of unknown function [Pseudodesulfovibrio piezophilus C1TLV30]|uniref:Uncharacterized protein n=1 Tax=Pseudodesulfovibrio piezophilus (strain DSM 21447 / JCM 15486 / C1TLV30) TaxID=1322246 RepID=M1WJR0_PSEP2|nr:protein of unknown function [Pseudodesulfovibrio piezophilus C1TLV30]